MGVGGVWKSGPVVMSLRSLQPARTPGSDCGGCPQRAWRRCSLRLRLCSQVRWALVGALGWQWLLRGSASSNTLPPGHTEKIYSLRFHPLAADVLVSSSYDLTIRIWDLQAGVERLRLQGHRDQVGQLRGQVPSHRARSHLLLPHLPPDLWPGLESQRAAVGHCLQGWTLAGLRAPE